MLVLLILIPILAAAAILLGAPARQMASSAASLNLLLTLLALAGYHSAQGGYQETFRFPILPEWGLNFFLGVDGLSLVMLLLTAIVTVAAIWVAPPVLPLMAEADTHSVLTRYKSIFGPGTYEVEAKNAGGTGPPSSPVVVCTKGSTDGC